MKKWLLRFLTFIVVIIALGLFGLKVISGTGEPQKKGLEQAFSQVFGGEARFGKLASFNLFPHFSLSVDNLRVTSMAKGGEFSVETLHLAFGTIDLIAKNRMVEVFEIKNLKASEGSFAPLSIQLDSAKLTGGETSAAGILGFSGQYGDSKIVGEIVTGKKSGGTPKFFFKDQNNFRLKTTTLVIDGIFSPYVATGSEISNLSILYDTKAGSAECKMPEGTKLPVKDFVGTTLPKLLKIKAAGDLKFYCTHLTQNPS